MGVASSGIQALDDDVDAVRALFKAQEIDDAAASDADMAALLAKNVTALRKKHARVLRGYGEPRNYVRDCLFMIARRALKHPERPRQFLALFRHSFVLDNEDAVTHFVSLVTQLRDKYDPETEEVVRAIDWANVCERLRDVFHEVRGATANHPTNQNHGGARTPLINMIMSRRIDIVRVLLERGADADAAAYNFEYPLHFAVKSGSLELIELLLEHSTEAIAYITWRAWSADALMDELFKPRLFTRLDESARGRLRPAVEAACVRARAATERVEAREKRKRARLEAD